jgi:hypothetical protein
MTAKTITALAVALTMPAIALASPRNESWSVSTSSTLEAAQHGNPIAQLVIGDAYLDGVGIAKDPAEGMRWLLKAAEAGVIEAELKVANLYYKGKDVPQNVGEAIRWYEKVERRGGGLSSSAEDSLGFIYMQGVGAPKDEVAAARWYRKAVDHGSLNAALQLAQIYEHPVQGEPDLVQSYAWYLVVGRVIEAKRPHAYEEARWRPILERRDGLAARMSPEQVEAAKRLALKFERKDLS